MSDGNPAQSPRVVRRRTFGQLASESPSALRLANILGGTVDKSAARWLATHTTAAQKAEEQSRTIFAGLAPTLDQLNANSAALRRYLDSTPGISAAAHKALTGYTNAVRESEDARRALVGEALHPRPVIGPVVPDGRARAERSRESEQLAAQAHTNELLSKLVESTERLVDAVAQLGAAGVDNAERQRLEGLRQARLNRAMTVAALVNIVWIVIAWSRLGWLPTLAISCGMTGLVLAFLVPWADVRLRVAGGLPHRRATCDQPSQAL